MGHSRLGTLLKGRRLHTYTGRRENTTEQINNVLVRLRTAIFRTGAYVFFSFEPLGGFERPIAQTKGPAERKKVVTLSTRSRNLRDCESTFFDFSTNMAKRAVHQNRP